MSLKATIDLEITQAMKSKNADRLRGLREIKAQLLLLATDDKRNVDNNAEMKVLQKMAKQRQVSITIFNEQNRTDLAEKEIAELAVINEYLPAPLTEAELKAIVKETIATTGAKTMADMGKVMPIIMGKTAGKADGKTISALIKKELS